MNEQPGHPILSPSERQQLEKDFRRLIGRYGPDAVRVVGQRETAKPVGRKADNDWPKLRPWLEMDARDWLDGRDPAQLRKPYFVGTAIAREHPGQSPTSTRDRIRSKLKRTRKPAFLIIALEIALVERPLQDVYRVIEALPAADPKLEWLAARQTTLLRDGLEMYRHRIGEPGPDMSFTQICDELSALPIAGIGSGIILERNRQRRLTVD